MKARPWICPVLAVLGLEVEHHQDHTVVCTQVHGVVIVAQLLLESLAGSHQIVQRLGDLGDASLIKGGHVPVEDTAGHGDGHALLAVGHVAGIHSSGIPLGQVDELGGGVQVHELAAVGRVVVQPVPVHLADILRVACNEGSSHLLFPAGPCGEGGLHGDVGVLSLESLQSALVSSVTAVAAPPADAQVDGTVRQSQTLICGSSGSLRSSSGRSGGRSSGLAAASSQQTCSTDSAGSHQEVTTRNCLTHFCSPPNRKHLHVGGLHISPLYTIMITKATEKRKMVFTVIQDKNIQILLLFLKEIRRPCRNE